MEYKSPENASPKTQATTRPRAASCMHLPQHGIQTETNHNADACNLTFRAAPISNTLFDFAQGLGLTSTHNITVAEVRSSIISSPQGSRGSVRGGSNLLEALPRRATVATTVVGLDAFPLCSAFEIAKSADHLMGPATVAAGPNLSGREGHGYSFAQDDCSVRELQEVFRKTAATGTAGALNRGIPSEHGRNTTRNPSASIGGSLALPTSFSSTQIQATNDYRSKGVTCYPKSSPGSFVPPGLDGRVTSKRSSCINDVE